MIRTLLLVTATVVSVGPLRAQQLRLAPTNAPWQATLAPGSEPGTRLTVSGRVIGPDGRPVAGASIYAYQTDATGVYVVGGQGAQGSDRPRLFTFMRADAQGRYAFTTVKPGSYPNSNNPAHIHFEVVAPTFGDRRYEIVFEGDPFISDNFRSRAKVPYGGVEIVTAKAGTGGALSVIHDIKLQRK